MLDGGMSAKQFGKERRTQLLDLHETLQLEILNRLSTETRYSTIPLVCKAFAAFARSPALWTRLEVSLRSFQQVDRTVACWQARASPGDILFLTGRELRLLCAACPRLQALQAAVAGKRAAAGLRRLAALDGLTSLSLSAPDLSKTKGLEVALAQLQALRHLRLDLPGSCPNPALRALQHLTCLTSLHASLCGPGRIPTLPSALTQLTLSVRDLPAVWPALQGPRSLQKISLRLSSGVIFPPLHSGSSWTRLTYLHLSCTQAASPTLFWVPPATSRVHLPQLMYFACSCPAFAQYVHWEGMQRLARLRLAGSWPKGLLVQGRGTQRLTESVHWEDMRRLAYPRLAGFGTSGLLAQGKDLQRLTALRIKHVQDRELPAVPNLQGLKELRLYKCGIRHIPLWLSGASALTRLELRRNRHLSLDAMGVATLRALPLRHLRYCVCGIDPSAAARARLSMSVLELLRGRLPCMRDCKPNCTGVE